MKYSRGGNATYKEIKSYILEKYEGIISLHWANKRQDRHQGTIV